MRFAVLLGFLAAAFATTLPTLTKAATGSGFVEGLANAKPVALTEFTALNVRNQGPEKAYGAVYFIDGLDPAARLPDDFKPTYPYLNALNARFGWDIFNAKYPNAERDVARSIPRSVDYVADRIKALKAQGYRRVVIAGQSWGAWLSINVADLKQAAGNLDGLMIVAPAAYGAKVWRGKDNPYYLQNFTEYVRHIKDVRIPTVAVFFRDDAFDPGQRGDVTDALFYRNNVPLMLIDQPAEFAGHGAGWLPSFADGYTGCINDFLTKPKTSGCKPAPHDTPGFGQIVSEAKISSDKQVTAVTAQDLSGKQFILTSPGLSVRVLKFGATNVEVATADGAFDEPLSTDADRACVDGTCYRLYRLSKDRYVGFDQGGRFAGWLAPVD